MTYEINPCLGCGCYDPDIGCDMLSSDKWYACPIDSELPENREKLDEMIKFYESQKESGVSE